MFKVNKRNTKTRCNTCSKLKSLKGISETFSNITCLYINRILKKMTLVLRKVAQPAITCLKLTIETLEHGVKHVQS